MKAVAVMHKGIEKISAEEIKELSKAKAKKLIDGRLLFEIKNLKPLEKARTIKALYKYITHFKFKKEEDIYKKAEKLKFDIKKDFVVRCKREGKQAFGSQAVEVRLGEVIFEKGNKVNLKKPGTTIYVEIIDNTCIIGVLYKKDMQKREYKVRLNSSSINAALAAAIVRFAEVKKKHTVIDPFCKDGVIPIEAALMGVKTVYAFDESLNNMKNTMVNAQVAKVKISVTKSEVDWIDTKFNKGEIDRIITNPPWPAKYKNKEEVAKTTKELFYQAKYVLKKDGLLVVITPKDELIAKYAKEYGFKLKKQISVVVGESIYKGEAFKP
ncbi:MAG: methyltransferase [Nanoarchaeota archaeon]|nr:methyltransferase [Nanoarchaeota archaeon]MCG2718976.1 THUMP domain-containing protein [Nanoarchaeota archaeon]